MLTSLLKTQSNCRPYISGLKNLRVFKYLKIYKKFERLGLATKKVWREAQKGSPENLFIITAGRKPRVLESGVCVGQHLFTKHLMRFIFGTENSKALRTIGSPIILTQLNISMDNNNNRPLTKAQMTDWAARVIEEMNIWNDLEFEKTRSNGCVNNNMVFGCIVACELFIGCTELKQSSLVEGECGFDNDTGGTKKWKVRINEFS